MSDETVLYIGKATSLRERVGMYYRTRLGARRPHAGGWWIKTLVGLDNLIVHYGPTRSSDGEPSVAAAEKAEGQMIRHFIENVSEETRRTNMDPIHPFPFASLEYPKGTRQAHGIGGATG